MVNNRLQHHGIKGQKWGVRRTPEQLGHPRKNVPVSINSMDYRSLTKLTKSGKDFVLSKNDKLYRATNEKLVEKGRLYVSARKDDLYTYANNIDYIGGSSDKPIYEKTYTLKKDVKVAGVNTQLKSLSKIVNEDLSFDSRFSDKGKQITAKYADVMNKDTKLRSDLIKRLSDKGYEAVVDMVDSYSKTGIGYTDAPLILFKSEQLIGEEFVKKYA